MIFIGKASRFFSGGFCRNDVCLFESDRGAPREDLRRALHDGCAGESDVDDRVRAHALRLSDHSADRDIARFGEHLGVGTDFAADEIAEACADVLKGVFRLDGVAGYHAERFEDSPLDGGCVDNDHKSDSFL